MGIADHDEQIGGLHRRRDLRGDPGIPDIDATTLAVEHAQAAGVDQREFPIVETRRRRHSITGDAAHFMHDRQPPTEDRIKERRLSHVGAADNGDHRPPGEFGYFITHTLTDID